MSKGPEHRTFQYDPRRARRTLIREAILLGLVLSAFLFVAPFLLGFLAMFEPRRLGDIPLSALVPVLAVFLSFGGGFWLFGLNVIVLSRILRTGRIAAAAVTLDESAIAITDTGGVIRFAWHDLDAATSDATYFFSRTSLHKEPIRALVLRPRAFSREGKATTGAEPRVSYVYTITRNPRHLLGDFDFRGLTIIPLVLMDPAHAAALCEEAELLHRAATAAQSSAI